jgi:hypothetical protein
MAVTIEDIVPSALSVTDEVMVRRGAGPLGHTMELVSPVDLVADLSITSAKLANDAVGNDKLANMSFGTIKARTTVGSGNPENATGTEVTALLDTFTSALKGLAPASGGGTANFLRADGTWAAPGGGGGSTATGSAVLDFGAAPGTNTVEAVVSTAIPAGASVRAWFQSEGNADHNEIEHRLIFPSRVGLTCGAITDGVGFTVYAETELRLTGDVTCRWQWSA